MRLGQAFEVTSRVISTPYGRPALDALRTVVSEAKRDDPMAPVTILVPNNIAGIVARRRLAQGLDGEHRRGVAGAFVTTLTRLAEQIAAPALHPRRPATKAVTAAAWRRALEGDAGCFERVKDHPATIRALAEAHRELRDLTPTARDSARSATTLTPDLLRLHEQVVADLGEQSYDVTDLLHTAAHLVTEEPSRTDELGHLVLHLPQSLTQAESAFATALAHTGVTVIAGMTGVGRADRAVRRTLSRLDLPDADHNVDRSADRSAGRNVGRSVEPSLATRVLHASDSDDEVRCVVRAVTRAVEQHPAHRVAVLYGAAEPYARLLHEHLAAAGLAVNGPATRAVHERAISRGFLGVLELAERGLPRADTFVALSQAPTSDLAGGTVPVARWERVSRAAGIVGGDDWEPKLGRYVADRREVIAEQEASDDPWVSRIDAALRDIHDAEQLEAFITRLRSRLAAGDQLATWPELSAWALDLFQAVYGDERSLQRLPREEQYAAVVVESALRGLTTLEAVETRADLTLLREVLSLDLESALPRVGRYGEGVFVGPVSAAVGMDLDAVFVVGLAEDGYPGRLHEDALLNDAVRDATEGELEPAREQLDAKHRHLLAAFAGAQMVTATFPRGDLRRSTQRLPSRFLLHTLRALTGHKELAATEWDDVRHLEAAGDRILSSRSFAESLTSTEQPASEQEWRVRAASADVDLGDEVVIAARELTEARSSGDFTRFDGNLGHVEGLPDFAHSDRVVSPTALETFASCPHRYFVQRLLRVEPLEHPEEIITISPLELGNFVHEVVDLLVTEAEEAGTLPSYGQPWSAAHRRRLAEIAAETAEEYAARGVTGHHRLWEAERASLLVDLERMLDDDDRWRAERQAAVVRSELEFGRNGAAPVVIPLPHGEVRVSGSADKVDRTSDGLLVVTDIKTGKADRFKGLDEDPVSAGTKLQLPVYAHAARQLLGGDRVEAMYWFVRGKDAFERIELTLDDELEKAYAETLATLVSAIANGLFVNKPSEKPGYTYVECEYCTPGGMGHDEARARYERKLHDAALEPLISLVDPGALAQDGEGTGA